MSNNQAAHNTKTCGCDFCVRVRTVEMTLNNLPLDDGLGVLATALFEVLTLCPKPEVALNNIFSAIQQELWKFMQSKHPAETMTAAQVLERQQNRNMAVVKDFPPDIIQQVVKAIKAQNPDVKVDVIDMTDKPLKTVH